MIIMDDNNVIAESENFIIWVDDRDEEEKQYHVELGGLTLHFYADEFDELVTLFREVQA
jgi:hypothetical protein